MRRLRRPTAFVLVSGEVPREETHPLRPGARTPHRTSSDYPSHLDSPQRGGTVTNHVYMTLRASRDDGRTWGPTAAYRPTDLVADFNPPDAPQLVPSVKRVIALTGRPPGTVVADRGFGTAANDEVLAALGVQRTGIQRKGTPGKARRAYEHTRAF